MARKKEAPIVQPLAKEESLYRMLTYVKRIQEAKYFSAKVVQELDIMGIPVEEYESLADVHVAVELADLDACEHGVNLSLHTEHYWWDLESVGTFSTEGEHNRFAGIVAEIEGVVHDLRESLDKKRSDDELRKSTLASLTPEQKRVLGVS